MNTETTVEALDSSDLSRVETLLEANSLPHEDIRDGPADFYGIVEDGEVIAVGGLEAAGSVGLLRSVVVEESHRDRGLGTQMCGAVEDTARDEGVRSLYLLTTAAAAFFRERGYAELERSEAPPAIRETTEFADACPSTAVFMRKSL